MNKIREMLPTGNEILFFVTSITRFVDGKDVGRFRFVSFISTARQGAKTSGNKEVIFIADFC